MYQSRNRRNGITSRFRLRNFDYSQPEYYFLTICIKDRTHRLGCVKNDTFQPSDAGLMVINMWQEQSIRFPGIVLDACCAMPNHFHGIVGIGVGDEFQTAMVSIPRVMQGFKAATSGAYGRGVREHGWLPYDGRLWQVGYHDHIVRNDRDLNRIRDYIESNPASWQRDGFYSE